jgi:hypothetical protein
MKNFLILLIVTISFLHLNGNTYYVSSTGNDSHTGTSQSPWKTLQYASDNAKEGDTVIVTAGEYAGFVIGWDGDQDGTSQNPIVFHANPGVIITSKNNKTADGINIEGASYIVIDGFTITNLANTITRAGIRSVENTGVVLKNNVIDGMGRWGIFTGFSENILIENNKTSNSKNEHGIYFSNSADNPIIRGNISFGNHGCGIHMNGDLSQGGDGIISNALVEQNIIYDNGTGGGSGINCDGVQNSTIRNNLLYNNHASGISFYKIDAAEPAKNNLVINNTIIMASDGGWAINITDGSTNAKVFNNILFTNQSYRGGLDCGENSLQGLQSDYNITIDRFTTNGGDNILSLAEWKILTSQDGHSALSTPNDIFVNAAANDYSLKKDCLAIDKGTNNNAPSVDIAGYIRPAGIGYDIGAYEFGSSPASIVKEHLTDQVKIFPNPAAQFVEIQSNFSIKKIDVYSLSGAKLKSYAVNNQTDQIISLNDYLPGTYLFCVFGVENEFMVESVLIP